MTYILDMVHHNPGEPPFESAFLDPSHLVDYGFNGQVFKHINCVATYAAAGVDCFPEGSPDHAWLDEFTPGIEREIAAAKAAGLKVFYHIDLFVMPKRLVGHFRDEICDPVSGRILLDRPKTLELHRVLFDELGTRFPEVDGYIIRVGETYLMDTPFHAGNGPIPRIGPSWTPEYFYPEALAGREPADARWTSAQVEAYVTLLGFLREQVCVRRDKQLFFRTWDIFPDKLHARLDHYLEVTDQIEPHPKLAFSIKHTALDFWRHVKVNECLTRGNHPQIIEVQCQREYEGKGAYPNYVMDGVINGFEENRLKLGLRDLIGNPKILGVYSWSRGGGWYGPYIENELWPDLNSFVLARFVKDPSRDEEDVFREYATDRLGLIDDDINRFRELCLLSARAVLKGRHCAAFDSLLDESVLPTACWMRDDRLGGTEQLGMVLETLENQGRMDEALEEKAEAVRIWERIVEIAAEIRWPRGADGGFVRVSSAYGLRLFRIVHHGWRALTEGSRGVDAAALSDAIRSYDEAWLDYRELSASPQCASLYRGEYFSLPGMPSARGLDDSVTHYKLRNRP
ncbi:MAG: hypothetical protein RLZZ214_2998 [Verrucomicrobiota bacterium]|jgi:hypothetical protein